MSSLFNSAAMSHGSSAFVGVFANDPVGEMKGIILNMILPPAIGILVARLVLNGWPKNVALQSRLRSVGTASTAIGMFLSAVGYFIFLCVSLVNTQDTHSLDAIGVDIALAAVVVGPIILIFGLILVVYFLFQASSVKPSVLNFGVYAASLLGVVLAYLWLRNVLST